VSLQVDRLEVTHETAQLIRDSAEAVGMTIDAYLRAIVEIGPNVESKAKMSLAEVESVLDELASGGENVSPLPENFSREDVYFDHD
jgi:hypothetical protein